MFRDGKNAPIKMGDLVCSKDGRLYIIQGFMEHTIAVEAVCEDIFSGEIDTFLLTDLEKN